MSFFVSYEGLSEEDMVKEQEEFVEFLKDNELYDSNESSANMVKLHKVWRIQQREIESMHEDLAGADI